MPGLHALVAHAELRRARSQDRGHPGVGVAVTAKETRELVRSDATRGTGDPPGEGADLGAARRTCRFTRATHWKPGATFRTAGAAHRGARDRARRPRRRDTESRSAGGMGSRGDQKSRAEGDPGRLAGVRCDPRYPRDAGDDRVGLLGLDRRLARADAGPAHRPAHGRGGRRGDLRGRRLQRLPLRVPGLLRDADDARTPAEGLLLRRPPRPWVSAATRAPAPSWRAALFSRWTARG